MIVLDCDRQDSYGFLGFFAIVILVRNGGERIGYLCKVLKAFSGLFACTYGEKGERKLIFIQLRTCSGGSWRFRGMQDMQLRS